MCIAKSLMTVFIAAFALTATDATAKDDIYRWVDDKGVVHFGNRDTADADAEKVDIRHGKAANAQYASDAEGSSIYQQSAEPSQVQQQRDERVKKRHETAELKGEIAAACEQRRQLVARLEPFTRVIVEGEDGEVYRMDDNERLKALDEAKSYIAENCDE